MSIEMQSLAAAEVGTFSEDMVGSKKSQNSSSLAFFKTSFFADF
jgi:hypothetical protein